MSDARKTINEVMGLIKAEADAAESARRVARAKAVANALREDRLAKLAKMRERAEAAGFTINPEDVFWVKGTTDALIDGMDADQWLDAMTAE